MRSPFKNPKNNEKGINQSLHKIIYKKVTAENYQENQDETFKECKRLFNQGASPKTLAELEKILRERQDEQTITKQLKSSKQGTSPEALAELEKSVGKKREHYNNYTQHFLPALLEKIILSRKLKLEEIKKIAGIVSDAIKQGGEEEYENFQRFLSKLETKIAESRKLKPEEKKERNAIIMKLKISDDLSKISDKDHSDNITQSQTDRRNSQISSIERSNDSESDSGRGSPRTNEESSRSPVSSRRSSLILVTSTSSEESLNSTLSSVEGDNGLQPEDEGETKLAHLTKTRSKGPSGRRSPSKYNKKIEDQVEKESPQVSSQCLTLGSREKENMDPNSQATQMTGSNAGDPMQPEEKRDRKNATTIVQKLPVNKNNSESTPSKKQPNNRNLYVALAAGCALLAVGCVAVAAKKESQIFYFMGAVLFVTAAMLAIITAVTWYLTPPSSELTSTNLSCPVDDKKFTACSVM